MNDLDQEQALGLNKADFRVPSYNMNAIWFGMMCQSIWHYDFEKTCIKLLCKRS